MAGAVTVGLAVALSVPGEWIPEIGPVTEFAAHAGAFAVVVGCWALAPGARVAPVLGIGLALAGLTEWLQGTYVPLRTGSAGDAAANALGVVVGLAVARALRVPPVGGTGLPYAGPPAPP